MTSTPSAGADPSLGSPTPAACPPLATLPDTAADALARNLAAAQDHGLLWRIEKDGRTSWLYGTAHVGRLEWIYPGPRLRQALVAIDVLAVELDPRDAQVKQAITAASARQPGLMTPERRERLARQREAACLPSEHPVSRMPPLMQTTVLSLLSARIDGVYADYAAEIVLLGYAGGLRKPVVSLEQAADQARLLSGVGMELDPGAQLDSSLQELESGQARALIREISNAWARSDLDRFERYGEWCQCQRTAGERRAMKRLIDARNPALADGIAALHDQGQRVFAAIGALHMVGPQGLPTLLAARGFAVTRVLPAP